MRKDNTTEAFFALVRGGLWETEVSLASYGDVDYAEVMRLAQEQAVIGLVAAGIEHVKDVKVPRGWALKFAGHTIQLEQRNTAMNQFIADLVIKMRRADIYALLFKGQGLAQCYEKPLWHTCGDIDFYMSDDNYRKAKEFLLPLSNDKKQERIYSKELGLRIESWDVELHGSQRTGLSSRMDIVIDQVQRDIFYGGNVRSWINGSTSIFLPGVDVDVFFVFTHFVKHFYKGEGACLRQICDWCRLLWIYREVIRINILEARLKKASLLSEWRAFAAIAVYYLGIPEYVMPFFSKEKVWRRKAERLLFLMRRGSQGRFKSLLTISLVFPLKAVALFPGILFDINWLKIKERIIPIGNIE